MAKTIAANRIVTAKTPRAARSISNRLKRRKMNTFGKTHNVMAWVTMFASEILSRYETRLFPCPVKAKIIRPIIAGNKNPETRPHIILSYFSDIFIS
jgi:hypothetical protein